METQFTQTLVNLAITAIVVAGGFVLIGLAIKAWRRDLAGIRTKIAAAIPGAQERIEAILAGARAFWAKHGARLVGIVLKALTAGRKQRPEEPVEQPAPDELFGGPVEVIDHDPEK